MGRWFEDFAVGDVYRHGLGRTVIAADLVWLALLTQSGAPLHIDAAYAAETEFGRPVVDSSFTLAVVTGQSVPDLSVHGIANLGWDRIRLPNPVFEGDTIYSQSEVLETRLSRSRPEAGIVRVRTVGFKQDGAIVLTSERSFLVYRRGQGPDPHRVEPRWDAGALKAAGLDDDDAGE